MRCTVHDSYVYVAQTKKKMIVVKKMMNSNSTICTVRRQFFCLCLSAPIIGWLVCAVRKFNTRGLSEIGHLCFCFLLFDICVLLHSCLIQHIEIPIWKISWFSLDLICHIRRRTECKCAPGLKDILFASQPHRILTFTSPVLWTLLNATILHFTIPFSSFVFTNRKNRSQPLANVF